MARLVAARVPQPLPRHGGLFLGLAGGLLVSLLNLNVNEAWVPTVLLVVDATASLLLLWRMRRAAIGLGNDVRFWHREIVRAERELPADRRVFTRFKLLQRSRLRPTRPNSPPERSPPKASAKTAWTG